MNTKLLTLPALLAFATLFVMAACASAVGFGQGDVSATNSELIGGEAGSPYNTGALKIAGGCTAAMIGPNQILTAAHCVVQWVRRAPAPPGDAGPGDPDTILSTLESDYAAGQSITFT